MRVPPVWREPASGSRDGQTGGCLAPEGSRGGGSRRGASVLALMLLLIGRWEANADGTRVFEARRPLQTGDEGDAQLAVGETGQMALAYWDPDNMPEGWSDDEHAQSADEGWIEVTLAE